MTIPKLLLRAGGQKTAQKRTRPDGEPSGRACETDARGRRGRARRSQPWRLVGAADPGVADIVAVGVVLALPAAAAIAAIVVAAVDRLGVGVGDRTGHDGATDHTGGNAPTVLARMRGGRNRKRRGKRHNGE